MRESDVITLETARRVSATFRSMISYELLLEKYYLAEDYSVAIAIMREHLFSRQSLRAETARGIVFNDQNANGVRDSGEPGLTECKSLQWAGDRCHRFRGATIR